ncbi:N-acetylmuramoyl-L-alanine amidase [Paenibacillus sp. GCM10027626]|uniref:N-acetylmuramoyl-L-alanine amidase n=1 Tax=Paenibacillus sp. GCM10027626 TaxID=3273411 RepID=UPI003637BD75
MNKTGWLTLVICGLLVITMSTTGVAKSSDAYSAKVLANNLNVRSEPSAEGSVVGKLNSGDIVTVSKEEHGWLKVSGGSSGWVAGYYLKQVANGTKSSDKSGGTVKTASVTTASVSTSAKQVSVAVDSLRLRGGPGKNYAVVTGAVRGDLLAVMDNKNGWMKVQNSAGEVGWVAGQYVLAASGTVKIASSGKSSKSGGGGGLKGKRIAVDPGHGGSDAGMVGTTYDTKEKDLNLKTALYLAEELRSRGAEVIMTRTKDEKPALSSRVEMSRKAGADAFVSIHYNSSTKKSSSGTLTFYYSDKKDEPLARAIEGQLSSQKIGLKSNGISFGNYHVLRENGAPSALVELGFLTNANDEELVRTSAYQKRAARAVAEGIAKYFQ